MNSGGIQYNLHQGNKENFGLWQKQGWVLFIREPELTWSCRLDIRFLCLYLLAWNPTGGMLHCPTENLQPRSSGLILIFFSARISPGTILPSMKTRQKQSAGNHDSNGLLNLAGRSFLHGTLLLSNPLKGSGTRYTTQG